MKLSFLTKIKQSGMRRYLFSPQPNRTPKAMTILQNPLEALLFPFQIYAA